jgi:hypothetical protein
MIYLTKAHDYMHIFREASILINHAFLPCPLIYSLQKPVIYSKCKSGPISPPTFKIPDPFMPKTLHVFNYFSICLLILNSWVWWLMPIIPALRQRQDDGVWGKHGLHREALFQKGKGLFLPWATLPARFVLGIFKIGSHRLFAQDGFDL